MGRADLKRLSDDSLAERFHATKGEMNFLEEIWRRYGQLVYGRCLRVLRHPTDAEDAASETFLNVRLGLLDGKYTPGNLRAWLMVIASNLCINKIQRADERRRSEPDKNLEAAGRTLDPEVAAEIESVLNKLIDKQRVTLKLIYFEGFSYEEVAAHEGWSVSEVKSHAQNGRRMFEKYWNQKVPKAEA